MPGLSCGTQDLQLLHVDFLVAACELLVAECGIQFPNQGMNPGPLHWELGVLPTGPAGKFLFCIIILFLSTGSEYKFTLTEPILKQHSLHPLAFSHCIASHHSNNKKKMFKIGNTFTCFKNSKGRFPLLEASFMYLERYTHGTIQQ